jgi:hypothetical protein
MQKLPFNLRLRSVFLFTRGVILLTVLRFAHKPVTWFCPHPQIKSHSQVTTETVAVKLRTVQYTRRASRFVPAELSFGVCSSNALPLHFAGQLPLHRRVVRARATNGGRAACAGRHVLDDLACSRVIRARPVRGWHSWNGR